MNASEGLALGAAAVLLTAMLVDAWLHDRRPRPRKRRGHTGTEALRVTREP